MNKKRGLARKTAESVVYTSTLTVLRRWRTAPLAHSRNFLAEFRLSRKQ